jgi:hypothetical protein
MKRWLFGIVAVISLLLAVASGGLWLETRAHYRNLRFERTVPGERERPTWESVDLAAHRGLVQVGRMRMTNSPNGVLAEGWNISADSSRGSNDNFVNPRRLGFAYFDKTWDATPRVRRRTTALVVPLWFLMLVFSIVPALWTRSALHRRRRATRAKRGLCVACGYDLRGSGGDVCPECGYTRAAATDVGESPPQTQTGA